MLVVYSALVSAPASHARDAQRTDALKADYLFNFLKFVEWPPLAPADTLTVCFLGDNGVYEDLSAGLAHKRLGTRRLVTHRLAPAEPTAACQVLYIEAGRLPDISDLIFTRPAGLLTVSDAPEFLQSGGVITLLDEGNRLRFRISVDNARRASLHISSKLLQLASTVERKG
jgi:hypothetical protein